MEVDQIGFPRSVQRPGPGQRRSQLLRPLDGLTRHTEAGGEFREVDVRVSQIAHHVAARLIRPPAPHEDAIPLAVVTAIVEYYRGDGSVVPRVGP